MSDREYDKNLLIKLILKFRAVFKETFVENGLVKDDKFELQDYAYVMMHMNKAFDVFDQTMDNHFNELVTKHVDPDVDGMTAQ